MSKYTTEVRYICEQAAGLEESKGFDSVENILTIAAPKIFNFNFPIFDENYRIVLEKKILKHYYTREIGAETVGLWKLWLDSRMNEIMPYYNQLYESELIDFNPLYNTDYTKEYQKTNDNETNTTDTIIGVKTDAMTGTIIDDGQDVLSQRGDIKDEGSQELSQNGTIGTERDYEEDNTGSVTTDEDSVTTTDNTIAETGTDTNAKTGTDTRTDNLHEARATHDKTNRWDYYNDTPQGGIQGVEDLEYLTNVRHITDDGTGSGGTTDNTGTQATQYGSTNTETKNLNTDEDGTVTVDGTILRTDNLHKEGSDDSMQTFNKVDATETENTKTFNKTDTTEKDNTRTYNTLNTINDSKNGTGKTLIDNIEDYTEHVVGKMPYQSFSKMLNDFRTTFLNIDKMIIEELSDLFMLIY